MVDLLLIIDTRLSENYNVMLSDERIVSTSSMVAYMKDEGWSRQRVMTYCRNRGWTVRETTVTPLVSEQTPPPAPIESASIPPPVSAPVNSTPPSIANLTPHQGDSLVCLAGSWVGAAPITYGFQWFRVPNTAVATGSSYLLGSGDLTFSYFCRVAATNSIGTVYANSNTVGPVTVTTNTAPANSGGANAPIVSGTVQQGFTLNCTSGSWSGSPTPTFTYQWFRAPSTAVGTGSSYLLQATDVGFNVFCRVTATNVVSAITADSNTLGPVTAAVVSSVPVLLLHVDGADGSTSIVDSSASAHTYTVTSGAQIDTAQSKFGGASLYNPTGAAYISRTDGAGADFDFGTGDFTIDFWLRIPNVTGQNNLFVHHPSNLIIYQINGSLQLYNNGAVIIGSTPILNNTWYHAALTRVSGTTRMFLDGIVQGTPIADGTNYASPANFPIVLSQGGLYSTECWMDELRVIKGYAAFTAAFTPATTAYGGGASYEAETTAWETAVVAATGTVSGPRKTLVDNLIAGLKTDGVWNKLDRLWLFAAENSQSALRDVKLVSVATLTGGPQFIVNQGYFVYGPGGYNVNLGYTPSVHGTAFTQNSAHISIWTLYNIASSDPGITDVPAVSLNIFPKYVSDGYVYGRVNENSSAGYLNVDPRGLLVANRSDATAIQFYKNGTSIGSNTVASITPSTNPLSLWYQLIATASVGGSLNSTEQTAFYSRLLTYMQGVFGVANVETMGWIRQVYLQGGTVGTTYRTQVDALISGLKTDGVWDKLDRLWLFAAENTLSALFDVKLGQLATIVGSPTFTANRGYATSSGNYLNTGYVPSGNYMTDSAHLATWVETATSVTGAILLGALGSVRNIYLGVSGAGVYVGSLHDVGAVDLASAVANSNTGFILGTRTTASARALYRNGGSIAADTHGSIDPSNPNPLFVGCRNNYGTADAFAPHRCAAVSAGAGLNSTEATALYNRLRTYMTAVGVP